MPTRLSTGIEGLDEILHGGLPPGRAYLVRGRPGSGKTTLALQFLLAGARRGETALFITLAESEDELWADAEAHGWDLHGVHILDIHPGDDALAPDTQYSIFHPADVELAPVTRRIIEAIGRLQPTRIVFDSLTEVRLLSRDLVRYRRQVIALKEYLVSRDATTLFLGESGHQELDVEVSSIVQGVIALSLTVGDDGLDRRSVRVEKLRGSDYQSGRHALRIERGGLVVFPRLVARKLEWDFQHELLPCGIAEMDAMLGGGLDRGSITMLGGNSGTGKTSLGLAFLKAAAERGERGVLFSFDETPAEVMHRCEAIGMSIRPLVDRQSIRLQKLNPLGLHPDEFASWIREEVERRGTRLLMIDTLNGYRMGLSQSGDFVGHVQQLVGYLKGEAVTAILVQEVAHLTGDLTISPTGMSYITDSVVLLKAFEFGGQLHKAIGVLKKRLGAHHGLFRQFRVTSEGLRVGEPIPELRGFLQGEATLGGWPNPRATQPEEGTPAGGSGPPPGARQPERN